MDCCPKHCQKTKVAKSSSDPLLWISSAVAKSINNPSSNPDTGSSCCQLRIGQTAHGKQEVELGKVLESVLVSSLDTVEDGTVLTVHLWILNSILFTSL